MKTSLHRKKRKLDLDKAVGHHLASLRKNNGMQQLNISEALEVQRPLVSKIENGHRSLGATEIVDYAKALGINPSDLFADIVDIVVEYDGRHLDDE